MDVVRAEIARKRKLLEDQGMVVSSNCFLMLSLQPISRNFRDRTKNTSKEVT